MPAAKQPATFTLRLGLVFLISSVEGVSRLRTLHAWKTIEFLYPSTALRQAAINSGAYIPGNSVPLDVDTWQRGGPNGPVFLTLPRLKKGVPATLVRVVPNSSPPTSSPVNGTSPAVEPFPDWSFHREGECDGLTSVFRVQTDQCGRLWVIDTGNVDILTGARRICQPQLVVFDIASGRLLYRMRFDDAVLKSESLLVTIAVDARGPNCVDSWAYIADVTGYGLIVLDTQGGIGTREGIAGNVGQYWRAISNLFYPYPLLGYFDLNGAKFDLMDGVLGLALGPLRAGGDGPNRGGGDRTLYFHSLASDRESWVATSILRNASNFQDGVNAVPFAFEVSKPARDGQAAASAMDDKGILYFSQLRHNSLDCWNSRRSYTHENIVQLDRDDEQLQFASGVKVIPDQKNRQQIWTLTSRFQLLMVSDLNPNEYNFHVLFADTSEATKGTRCNLKPTQPFPQGQETGRPNNFFPSTNYLPPGSLSSSSSSSSSSASYARSSSA